MQDVLTYSGCLTKKGKVVKAPTNATTQDPITTASPPEGLPAPKTRIPEVRRRKKTAGSRYGRDSHCKDSTLSPEGSRLA